MSGRKYYCFCESNCKFETMNKEQIISAIAQAAETGLTIDEDAAFITKVKEMNAGGMVTFWVGTQAQYNALESIEKNCLYIITDSKKEEELEAKLEEIKQIAAEGPKMQLLWATDKKSVNGDVLGYGNLDGKIEADFSAYTMLVLQFVAREELGVLYQDDKYLVIECAAIIGSGKECVVTYAGASNTERRYIVEADGVTMSKCRVYNSNGDFSIDDSQLTLYRIYGLKG